MSFPSSADSLSSFGCSLGVVGSITTPVLSPVSFLSDSLPSSVEECSTLADDCVSVGCSETTNPELSPLEDTLPPKVNSSAYTPLATVLNTATDNNVTNFLFISFSSFFFIFQSHNKNF